MVRGMEGRGVAQAGVGGAFGDYGRFDRAVCVFSPALGGSIHCLLEGHAFWAAAYRECPAWAPAADLRRPVRLGTDGAGGGGCVSQAAGGGAKVVCHFRAELRAGWRDRFFWPEVRIAAGAFRPSKLFLLGAARLHG